MTRTLSRWSPSAIVPTAALAGSLLAPATVSAVPLQWASFSGSNTGTLNGVGFTISNMASACCNGGTDVSTMDLSGATWGNSGNQQGRMFDQNFTTTFTITFNSAVSNLQFYLYYFRGASGGGGYNSYDFGQSFSILSGLDAPITQTGTTLDTSSSIFASGVIAFASPITSLTVTTTGTAIGGDAGFTMASVAAPVPGGAGLTMVALATVFSGRRRR